MGMRVIKTAIAATAALYIAQALQLHAPVLAGLLAIFAVDVTRKGSLKNAFIRAVSTILGLLFAILMFWILGFHAWVVGLYILIAYPLMIRMKLKDGIVASCVIVLQVYVQASLDIEMVRHFILLLLVGLGTGTVVNLLYMPGTERNLKERRETLEKSLSSIFTEISKQLRDPAYVWKGSEIIEAHQAIKDGKKLAERASGNDLFSQDPEWINYFAMRERQMETLKHMLLLLARVYKSLPYGEMAAEMFDELADVVRQEYYTGEAERHLIALRERYRSMPLPATRDEFETRSAILQMLMDLGHYLNIAKELKKKPVEAAKDSTMSKSS